MYNRKYWGLRSSSENKTQTVVTTEIKETVTTPIATTESTPTEPVKKETCSKNTHETNNNYQRKSKIAAGLFGIFLGYFGIHNFYLGYTGKGVAQLLLSTVGLCFTCGFSIVISAIWGLIEGILILTGSIDKDAHGYPLKD